MAVKKDWVSMITDGDLSVGHSLKDARDRTLKFYKNECVEHGIIPYRVLDNSCPLCVQAGIKRRHSANKTYNRLRGLVPDRKRRASQANIPFEITVDDVRELTPAVCPVLGVELSHTDSVDFSPSIDRLDSSKGYTVENIRIISTRANRIKSDGTVDEHLRVAEWMKTEGM